ncbi:MAG: 4-hydroxy-tetrahydrodipicolinate reductase [Muribaculaceae bacterium]|nr:4-hydroxy-tetrahydrodipicolinate reductase [Muribaculaceae bacterium]MDE6632201.1 4-hydroxy-tetrahydrodipicolinate reductase [Muribaculaceae bacterium]
MKIAIIGYGKMGHMIEQIAKDRGHEISVIIDADNLADIESKAFRKSDVAIEFSQPDTAVNNLLRCFSAGVPVVCGTTGWLDSLDAVKSVCESGKGAMLYSSNFSIGVNIFEAVSRYLAGIMNSYPQYTPSMEEVHHIHKLDHPSGTAITIAEELIATSNKVDNWKEPDENPENPENPENTDNSKTLIISHRREGEVPGIHTVTWDSPQDTITISHSAKSREGFALGAVLAAEWLAEKCKKFSVGPLKIGSGQTGFFTMKDMLKF